MEKYKSIKNIDWSTSEKVAIIIDARLGECVANVVRAFLDFRNCLPKDAVYVEGLWKKGGQLGPHTWIETNNNIIDPTLVCETNRNLRESAVHYPMKMCSEDQVRRRYGDQPRGPGVRLEMELDWDDPRVQRLAHEVDPP